jgi:tetratricopeptide (TPR) repeat protein
MLLVFISLDITGQTARKYIKAGEEFTRNGMLEDAIDQYSKAIDEDPSSADGYVRGARVYEMTGNFGLACDDYRRANSFLPDDTGILHNLGRMCNLLGSAASATTEERNRFYAEAVTYLQKAIRAEFRNGKLYTEKVISLIGMEMWDQALAASDTALQLRDDAVNYYHQGIIYQKKGDDNTARRQLEKAVTKDKSYATARLELARVLVRQGDVNSALGQCNMVIQQDSKNVEAYLTRAIAYEEKLDYPAAINVVSPAIPLEPAGQEHYVTRGTLYQKFNQHLAAVSDFTKALTIDQFRPDVYLLRARSYEEIHDFEKAADDYTRVVP